MNLAHANFDFVSIPSRWGLQSEAAPQSSRRGASRAFTLVELLVVISVIALLAGLTVGLSGVASRKSKEARIRGDLNRLVTLIEDYKGRLGAYPPSPETLVRNTSDRYDIPKLPPNQVFINQLFYELAGTIFTNRPQTGFYVLGRQPSASFLSVPQVSTFFQVDGFANSARDKRNVKYTTDFKSADVKEIKINNVTAEFLVCPVAPPLNPLVPALTVTTVTGARVYPWFYDSSSPNRINADGFDLWTVVEIGKKIIRFSNWESGPVVIGP